MSTVLAIDPGKISGWAAAVNGELVAASELPHFRMSDYAAKLIGDGDVDEVVSESFVISQATLRKSRGGNWSLYQIGVLEWLCHTHELPFTLQSPAEGKSFGTDDKLRKLGWYERTPGGHRNDAARHLLVYLTKKKQIDLRRLV